MPHTHIDNFLSGSEDSHSDKLKFITFRLRGR